MDFGGKVLDEHSQELTLLPLVSKIYYQQPMTELLQKIGVDPSTVFLTTELTIDGKTASSNLIYLVPTKQIRLPLTAVSHSISAVTGKDDTYNLTVDSKVLARSVYVSFEPSNVDVSDNYFDLLPNTPQTITLHTSASMEELNRNVHVISLVDAFAH